MFFNLYHRMVNPSSCRIWGLGALNHSFCAFESSVFGSGKLFMDDVITITLYVCIAHQGFLAHIES